MRAWHATDPRCVICETVTSYEGDAGDRPVFGHLVPASVITPGATGGKRGGYTADNAMLMCSDCNHRIGARTVVEVAFIPSYFGTFPSVKRVRRSVPDYKCAAVERMVA